MTFRELNLLREHAIRAYKEMRPSRTLEGAPSDRGSNEDEMRLMSIFEASVLYLSSKGMLAPGVAEQDILGLKERTFESVLEEA